MSSSFSGRPGLWDDTLMSGFAMVEHIEIDLIYVSKLVEIFSNCVSY